MVVVVLSLQSTCNMNKQSFDLGVAHGIGLAISKYASGLGTYFASGAIPREEMAAHPYRTGLMQSIPYAGDTLAHAVSDVTGGVNAKKNDPFGKLNSSTYSQTMGRRGLAGFKQGLPISLLAGLAAGGLYFKDHDDRMAKLLGVIAAGAPIAMGAGGALGGAYDKFVANHTSDNSQAAAVKMKSEHPFLSALPFGDAFGAGFYDTSNKK